MTTLAHVASNSTDVNNNASTKSSCAPFPDSPHLCTDLANVRRSVAVLSLVGCLLVLFLIWLLRKYERSPAQRIIFWLTMSAAFHSIGGCLADPDTHPNSAQCQIQAFMVQFGVWAIMLWIGCIAFNVSWNVLGVRRRATLVSFETAYHSLCWSLSIVMSTVPFAVNAYGHTGGWCWITGKHTALRFGAYYVPLYVLLAGILLSYALIARKLARSSRKIFHSSVMGGSKSRRRQKKQKNNMTKLLFAYPLLFLALAAFPLINRVYQAARGEGKAVFALAVMHAISIQIMGVANALLYGLKKENIAEIHKEGFVVLLKGRLQSVLSGSKVKAVSVELSKLGASKSKSRSNRSEHAESETIF